ncbi:MAG: permease-like cell division protein FtsX [Peptococcaceae bacterium]|nr:permease-like cell division protein FtsX [Peptococcaceae bacterium]
MEYVIKQALRSLIRNIWLSVASIMTMMVSLAILGFALIALTMSNTMAAGIESSVRVSAFVGGDGWEEDVAKVPEVEAEIRALPQVTDVKIVDPDEALQTVAQGKNRTPEELLQEDWGGVNGLAYRYDIDVSDVQAVPDIAVQIQNIQGVNRVEYDQEYLEIVSGLTDTMKIGGILVVGVLTFATFVLISLNIRANVFSREKEIQIMRLVGASNTFIRGPFFVEGVLVGSIGAVIAVLVVGFGSSAFIPSVTQALNFLPIEVNNVGLILGLMVGVGVFIGTAASMLSIRRFLKV